jgi:hypothetical protein
MDNLTPGRSLPRSRPAFDSCASTTFGNCSLSHLTALLLLSLGSLLSDQVEAADSCRRATTVINGPVTIGCTLGDHDALTLTPTGSIDVASGAAVSVLDAAARQILNQGSLAGTVGIAIDGSDGVGKISNAGTITGAVNALRISNSRLSGPLINSGTLQSPSEGYGDTLVKLDHAILERGFANSGTIDARAAEVGVAINISTVTGNVDNSGLIYGGSQGLLIQSSQINGSVRNTGTLDTALGNSLQIESSHITGDVFNSGSIAGYTFLAQTTVDGRFINAGQLRDGINAFDIYQSTVSGGVYNSGWIYSGEGVQIRESVLKRFENTGIFSMSEDDLSFDRTTIQGDLINHGSIAPSSDGFGGLAVYGGEIQGNLINTGTIEGGLFGPALRSDLQARIAGDLVNSGRLIGAVGVDMRNTSIGGDFINRASIIGNFQPDEHHGSGLLLKDSSIGGNLLNTGLISGREQGAALSNVQLAGDFINRGRINAAQEALNLTGTTVAGRWSNYGYIGVDPDADVVDLSADANGITLSGSSLQGRVTNLGTVRGSAIGLDVLGSQFSDGLVNAGTIRGSNYSLYVDDSSRLDNLYIAGNGTARFQGTVYAPATTATIYSDARYRLEARDVWQVKSLVNRGTLELAAPAQTGSSAPSLSGDYVQKPDAILRTHVQDAAHYGRLDIYGTATLPSQARIDVDVAQARQPFTANSLNYVLTATQLISDGTFIVTSNSALFNFGARKVENRVDLLITPKAANGVASAARAAGLSASIQGAAQVVDQQLALGSASTLAPYFVSATSSAQVASSLAQALPQDNAALRASQATLASIGYAVNNRLDDVTGLSTLGAAAGQNPAGKTINGFWSQPFSYSSGLGNSTVEGASGTVIGFDLRISPEQRSGWAFAYANGGTGSQQPNGQQRSRLDLWQFLGYSSYTVAPGTELKVYGGAGRNSVDADRRLAIAGVSGSAKAEYDSLMATLGTSIGHALQLSDSARLIPSLRLDYNHIRDGAYSERGSSSLAPLLLNVAARDTDQLIAGFDTQLEQNVTASTQLRVNLGVGYDLINRPASTTAAFAGAADQRFSVRGEDTSPWLMRGGLGVATRWRNGAELSLDYDAQTRTDFTDQVASVRASVPF